MDQLKAMSVFVRCVERGSLSAVAAELGTTQPAVSKQIARLEAHLGGALFVRSARGVRLTPEGASYYERCRGILDALSQADEGFGHATDTVRGTVCIASSLAFGRRKLMPHVAALLSQHPQLKVDLQLNDRMVDLVAEGVDLAFRFGRMPDSALLARRVGLSRRILVASRDYLGARSRPRAPADLLTHDCIDLALGAPASVWKLAPAQDRTARPGASVNVPLQAKLRTNSAEAAHEAAAAGLGVAAVSAWLVAEDLRAKRLVRVLPDWSLPPVPIHLVMPRASRQLTRVRVVAEFLEQQFRHDRDISPE